MWKENEHPRDDDGKFTSGGGAFRQNASYGEIKKENGSNVAAGGETPKAIDLATEDIRKGLKALGLKGKATVKEVSQHRYKVTVNGEYFGLWDAEKKTFVD